jgi:hypothetical protein
MLGVVLRLILAEVVLGRIDRSPLQDQGSPSCWIRQLTCVDA